MATKNGPLKIERVPFQFALNASLSQFESGKFAGIASVFGSVVDTWPNRTKFRKGAFAKTISERADRIKILHSHDPSAWIGLPTKIEERPEGLYMEVSLNNTERGRDAAEALRHAASLGMLSSAELSIGFDCINAEMVEDEEDKELFREVTEARLYEASLVAFGADRQTRIMEAARLDMEREYLLPRREPKSVVEWTIACFKSFREGAAPAPLTEEQRKQITEELALHAPAEPPKPSALTDYEIQRQLSAIKQAEAEMAFAGI